MIDGKRWTLEYPELGTGPVPIQPCISPEYFELEREKIFRRVWLNIGREDQIPKPGDYFVKELAICDSSILVVRGKDGVIRSFHNVCSHRANRVTRECSGKAMGFVCGFHGWTYDLKGRLVRVPDEDEFFDFERSENGLSPVATDVWEGFIFINLNPRPEQKLIEFLGEVAERLSGYPFGRMSCFSHKAEVKANWKVAVDAFQEGYHAVFVHKRSVGSAYVTKENPFLHALDITLYKRHRMMSVPGSLEYQPTPLQAITNRFGASVVKRDSFMDQLPPGVNQIRSPTWGFDQIIFFPNSSIFVFDGTYITYHFWPLAVDRTLWETRTYYPRAENAGQRFSQEYAKCILRDTLMEDGSILEDVQSTLASGAKTHFIPQDQEILIRHFHKVCDDFVAGH